MCLCLCLYLCVRVAITWQLSTHVSSDEAASRWIPDKPIIERLILKGGRQNPTTTAILPQIALHGYCRSFVHNTKREHWPEQHSKSYLFPTVLYFFMLMLLTLLVFKHTHIHVQMHSMHKYVMSNSKPVLGNTRQMPWNHTCTCRCWARFLKGP